MADGKAVESTEAYRKKVSKVYPDLYNATVEWVEECGGVGNMTDKQRQAISGLDDLQLTLDKMERALWGYLHTTS